MHTDVERTIELKEQLEELWKEIYEHQIGVMEAVKRPDCPYSAKDLVNLGYLNQEFGKTFDECRKDANARRALIDVKIGILTAEDPNLIEEDTAELTIRSDLASGTVVMKMLPQLPKRGTPEADELYRFFGAEPERFDPQKGGILSLNWNKAVDVATKCFEEGRPMPPGFSAPKPKCRITYRPR